MSKFVTFLCYHLGSRMRTISNFFDRKRYNASKPVETPTIISQNCAGCLMSHDLGLPFNSPTVNLFMDADSYIRFVENLDYYLSLDAKDIRFIKSGCSYPVGLLEDIKIHFVHYSSEKEAIQKWNERRIRVDKSNLFLIMTDRDGCTEDIFQRFISLQEPNKVFFSHEQRNNDCVVFMPCFQDEQQVGSLTDFCNIFGKRYYAKYFDYINWLRKM